VTSFFIPHLQHDVTAAETEWQRYLAETPAPPGSRRVHKLTYEDSRGRYEVTVGAPRKQFRRQTGPRGGRIPNADFERLRHDTGTVVSGIIDTGDLLYIWSYGPPFGEWHNPSMVGRTGVRSIEYFDEAPAAADASSAES
jgi:hypothetical protein